MAVDAGQGDGRRFPSESARFLRPIVLAALRAQHPRQHRLPPADRNSACDIGFGSAYSPAICSRGRVPLDPAQLCFLVRHIIPCYRHHALAFELDLEIHHVLRNDISDDAK
jgi:hypothetical protein